MKPFTTLVLLLCTLLSGFGYAHKSDHVAITPGINFHVQKNQGVQTQIARANFVIQSTADYKPVEHVLCVVEDDDQDELNKTPIPSRYFLTCYNAIFLSNRHCSTADCSSLYKPPYFPGSCKYLKQRVLRI